MHLILIPVLFLLAYTLVSLLYNALPSWLLCPIIVTLPSLVSAFCISLAILNSFLISLLSLPIWLCFLLVYAVSFNFYVSLSAFLLSVSFDYFVLRSWSLFAYPFYFICLFASSCFFSSNRFSFALSRLLFSCLYFFSFFISSVCLWFLLNLLALSNWLSSLRLRDCCFCTLSSLITTYTVILYLYPSRSTLVLWVLSFYCRLLSLRAIYLVYSSYLFPSLPSLLLCHVMRRYLLF